ncbi:MAG: large ribosomal subunit protein bL35 [Planctomycetota bacterium]
MPKNKPNKGLMKRIRITKSGRIKMGRSGGRHLRSHKSGKLRRDYRKPKYAVPCEARRMSRMLFMPAPPASIASSGEGSAEE